MDDLNDPYGNISAAAPPRAIASQWGEPMGSLPHTGAKTKIEQTKAKPCNGNQPTPLKGSPRLGFGVNASREPMGPLPHTGAKTKIEQTKVCSIYCGDPYGNRTHVTTVKG